MSLTQKQIEAAKPGAKPIRLRDSARLQVRIQPTGAKVFYARVNSQGKQTTRKLGEYPAMSLKEARQAAEALAQELEGLAAVIEDQELVQTFEATFRQWFAIKKLEVKDWSGILETMENHALPALGALPIDQVKAAVVVQTLQPLADAGKLETLKRVAGRINMVLDYATNCGMIEGHSCHNVKKAFPAPKPKRMPAMGLEQLPLLLITIEFSATEPQTRRQAWLQLLTATRPTECAQARWDEIDMDARTWLIPSERMKMGRDHHIPLTAAALHILEEQKARGIKSPWVFPNQRDHLRPGSSSAVNMMLKRAGLQGKQSAHGFRALFSTAAYEAEWSSDVVEACLAHQDRNQVRAAYNRAQFIQQRERLLSWWADFLADARAQGMGKPKSHPVRRLSAV